MTWEEYYRDFYNWEGWTQARKIGLVDKLGPGDEVAEVINELYYVHPKVAYRLVDKAISQGIVFSVEGIERLCDIETPSEQLRQILISSAKHYSEEQLESLIGFVDDDILLDAYKENGYNPPKEYINWLDQLGDSLDEIDISEDTGKPVGLLDRLVSAFGSGTVVKSEPIFAQEQRVPKFNVYDHVHVKYRGQEGTIIDINDDLYMVSLEDGSHVDSYYEDQLEKCW